MQYKTYIFLQVLQRRIVTVLLAKEVLVNNTGRVIS